MSSRRWLGNIKLLIKYYYNVVSKIIIPSDSFDGTYCCDVSMRNYHGWNCDFRHHILLTFYHFLTIGGKAALFKKFVNGMSVWYGDGRVGPKHAWTSVKEEISSIQKLGV
jgi:hypothetical protein